MSAGPVAPPRATPASRQLGGGEAIIKTMSDSTGAGGWKSDLLGEPYEALTLVLAPDEEGEVVATLVRSLPAAERAASLSGRFRGYFKNRSLPLKAVDVLYVHGWSDYFFQKEVAEFWNGLGARFFALDLRKYGRSLRPGDTEGYVTSLETYDEDIEAALSVMGTEANGRRLVLLGHSTGGLTLTCWAARNRGRAAALILNSPWLEFQTGAAGRVAMRPLVKARTLIDPKLPYPNVDFGFYTRALRQLGTLPTSPGTSQWRRENGFKTTAGWLLAILEAQEQVSAGLDTGCPVLTVISTESILPLSWNPKMTAADSVLVLEHVAANASRISPSTTIARVEGAVHDVFLSAPASRKEAFEVVRDWLLSGVLETSGE